MTLFVGTGLVSLDPNNVMSPRHLSLPSETSNSYNDVSDFVRHATELGLGDTGRIISSALSDGYLPNIGMDDTPKVCIYVCVCVYDNHSL